MTNGTNTWLKYTTLTLCAALCLPACGKQKTPETAAEAAGEAKKAAGAATVAAGGAAEAAGKAAAPDGPQRVFFVTPKDGEEISGPADADGKVRVAMKFGVEGMVVKPAGTNDPNSGHHHVIVDGASIPQEQPVPMDEMHIHFGKGQTEAGVALSPGKHKLTMQFANYAHMSYGALMATTIEISVVVATPPPSAGAVAGGEGAPVAPVGDLAAQDKAAAEAAKAAGTPVAAEGAAGTTDAARKAVEAARKAAGK